MTDKPKWTVQDTMEEVAAKYSDVLRRLAGNGHTNGCSCLECLFVAYGREVKEAAQGQSP